jgi:hypothetical protein
MLVASREIDGSVGGSVPVGPRALAGVVLLCVTGCHSLDRFDTTDGAEYCGKLLAPGFASTGLVENGDQASQLRLKLSLSTKTIATRPGVVSSNDQAFGICTPQPLFNDAPLRTIEPALHDEISLLRIGEGHEEDVLVWVDSTCSGSMLAVLSLIADGHVELRVFRPRPEPSSDTPIADTPGFGVFSLEKRRDGCDF